jgi:hypothetical protein
MKKQIVIVAGVLLTLGTAFSETDRTGAQAPKSSTAVDSASIDISAKATEQVLSLWQSQARAAASTHLARPL